MVKSGIKKLVEHIEKLPTLPIIIQEILKKLEDPEVTPQEINNLVQHDQAFLSKILRLVNSAFYGFSGKISTVTQAIIILGFNTIKSLALSTTVFDRFKMTNTSTEIKEIINLNLFWQHSIGVGVCSRMIAQRMRLEKEQEEVFVSGILHDLGKIIMIEYARKDYEDVIKAIKENNYLDFEAEESVFGFNHSDVGMWLAKHWKLPLSLEYSIHYHHKPEEAKEFFIFPAIVHISDIIIYSQKIGLKEGRIPPLSEIAWKMTGLSKTDIEYIVMNLSNELKKAELFHLLVNA
ncbi:MAG: HDOD domain-containing protein [Candidatus Hydrogenedentota bacterium]